MISTQCSSCHATYNLKDEFAGKSAKCPNCQSVFLIPQITSPGDFSSHSTHEHITTSSSSNGIGSHSSDTHSLHASGVFAKHIYGIKQKRIAINEKYYIRDADNRDVFFALRRVYIWRRLGAIFLSIIVLIASIFFLVFVGSSMDLPMEVLMPVFLVISIAASIATFLYLQPLRHIEFFNSESDTLTSKPEFTVTQDKKIELITQNYTLRDKMGTPVAFFSKNQFTNIIRRKWHVRYGSKYVLIQEDSIILSLMRRLLPFGQFIRTNFVYFQMKNHTEKGIILGMFKRKIELFDNYVLDLSPDSSYSIPRQVAIAIAVLLDTGEKR